jgi:hypothetical protein
MLPKHYDPVLTPSDRALVDDGCPKCGTEMEPIEMGVQGPPVQKLQLCPSCYLVTWSDQNGLHVQQGVPVKKRNNDPSEPDLSVGGAKEC